MKKRNDIEYGFKKATYKSYMTPIPLACSNKKTDLLTSASLACTTALFCVNFTHPIETIKTRIQVSSNFSPVNMIKKEGVSSLWKGIQAAWLREASYTTIKLGGYAPIRDIIGANDKNSPFFLKFFAGAISGSLGSIVGNPFDVMKTKMMANSKKTIPLSDMIKQMYLNQGISGFYRGIQANVSRACVLNGTKMACYDQIKGLVSEKFGWERKDIKNQFVGAIGAGFFMACTVTPFDMLRTTLMNQPTDKIVYKGMTDAFSKIVRKNGILVLYRGFFPIWCRFAPQATLQLITMDTLLKFTGYNTI